MGISQSLYTAWTGLATHQRSLDNTGNNLANANTVGFKKNEFLFSNLFNQTLSGSMPAGSTHSSTTGVHQGTGVTTGAISTTFRQGPLEPTGRNLDVAINGGGFFLVNAYGSQALTRSGSFYLDHTESPNQRLLCSGDGYPVQGWSAQDGAVVPSAQVGNIYLPTEGDLLPGLATGKATLDGILPSNATGDEFTGNATRNLDVKGNLAAGKTNTLSVSIYAPVTQTLDGSAVAGNEIQEIPVQITFTGPEQSENGDFSAWNWRMSTVDWPRPGDPSVQIYPPANGAAFEQGTVRFYNQADVSRNRGAGQVAEPVDISPGSAAVSSSIDTGSGVLDTSFSISSGFSFDVSRLTALASAPGGEALEAWHVDGNPAGSMARTITVYDEVTRFVPVDGADGSGAMEAVRRVEARQNTFQFAKTGATSSENNWTWKASAGPASGSLAFDTTGALTGSTASGGEIAYDFAGLQSMNYAASLTAPMQDGYVDGYLEDISIDQYGRIFGHYSNDVAEPLAQLALATVPNTGGLDPSGGTLFYTSPSSGGVMIGVAGDEKGAIAAGLDPIGAGTLTAQHLEGANVELANEFTTLISTERGYQASARVVTTSDEMLQTLVQLKR